MQVIGYLISVVLVMIAGILFGAATKEAVMVSRPIFYGVIALVGSLGWLLLSLRNNDKSPPQS